MGLISLFVEDMLRYILAALPLWAVLRIAYLKLRIIRTTVRREVILGACVLYGVGLLSQTVLPPGSYGFEGGTFYALPIIRPGLQHNLVPMRTIAHYIFGTNASVDEWDQVSRVNLLGNVLLFAPFGFMTPLLRLRNTTFWHVIGLGAIASVAIEVCQFFFGRTADIDDVILNLVGVGLGYLLIGVSVRAKAGASSKPTIEPTIGDRATQM